MRRKQLPRAVVVQKYMSVLAESSCNSGRGMADGRQSRVSQEVCMSQARRRLGVSGCVVMA